MIFPPGHLIGFTGYSRSGKDTAAEALTDHVRVAFADKVRQFLYQTSPTARQLVDQFGWERAKTLNPELVDWQIAIGQAARDVIHPDVWLDIVRRRVRHAPGKYVVTDVRQPNEIEWVISQGGRVYRIVRSGTTPRAMDREIDDLDLPIIHNTTPLHDQNDITRQQFIRKVRRQIERDIASRQTNGDADSDDPSASLDGQGRLSQRGPERVLSGARPVEDDQSRQADLFGMLRAQ